MEVFMNTMHKQFFSVCLFAFLFCFLFSSCSTTPANTPEEAVEGFMQAYFQMDADMLQQYAVDGETELIDFVFFKDSQSADLYNTEMDIVRTLTAMGSYELTDLQTLSNGTTLATLTLTYYDCSPLFQQVDTEWLEEIGETGVPYYTYAPPRREELFATYSPTPTQIEIQLMLRLVNNRWMVEHPSEETYLTILANWKDLLIWHLDYWFPAGDEKFAGMFE